jgi:Protein of unknown function (DUF1566)
MVKITIQVNMKNTIIALFVMWTMLSAIHPLYAQVAITNTGSPPDASAMLDIQSSNKGLLLPRIDFNNKPANPAAGLLVYVTAHGPFGSGLYLFDGTGWVMISLSTYYRGEVFGGGIIFNLDSTGHHGLVVTAFDQGNFQWGCDTTLIGPAAQHLAIMTGDTNTTAIVAFCPMVSNAAMACDTLTLNGYTDWYLPSRDELDSLAINQAIFGGLTPDAWYWSSSEVDYGGAHLKINQPYWLPFDVWANKMYALSVRCIRKF